MPPPSRGGISAVGLSCEKHRRRPQQLVLCSETTLNTCSTAARFAVCGETAVYVCAAAFAGCSASFSDACGNLCRAAPVPRRTRAAWCNQWSSFFFFFFSFCPCVLALRPANPRRPFCSPPPSFPSHMLACQQLAWGGFTVSPKQHTSHNPLPLFPYLPTRDTPSSCGVCFRALSGPAARRKQSIFLHGAPNLTRDRPFVTTRPLSRRATETCADRGPLKVHRCRRLNCMPVGYS
jgi:hypothetical protein